MDTEECTGKKLTSGTCVQIGGQEVGVLIIEKCVGHPLNAKHRAVWLCELFCLLILHYIQYIICKYNLVEKKNVDFLLIMYSYNTL